MTLGDFFQWSRNHPMVLLGFFFLVPMIALLTLVLTKENERHSLKYLFSTLIYLVALPGIFAVTLSIYLFLFERRSIMDTNIYTQILPIVSMLATFILIRKQINLDLVPGFDKLSGLITIISVLMAIMWFIDKTHIYAITFMPFYVVIIILVVGYLFIRLWLKQLTK
jgi:hypothetical protein